MKEQRKFKRRPMIIIGLLILLCVSALIVAKLLAMRKSRQDFAQTSSNESMMEDSIDKNKDKDDKNDDKVEGKPEVVQYEGEDPNTLEEITGYLSYNSVNEGFLRIRVAINQLVDETGSCELVLTSSSDGVVKKTAKTVGGPSTGTCEGFDVPISELGVGDWNIEVKVDANGKSGIIKGEATIK